MSAKGGTERPFQNEYWNNHRLGIYVDIVSGGPRFSSKDKFDSGTGWPSFSRPLSHDAVRTKLDSSLGMDRVEVRSAKADSRLGHVFADGLAPGVQRYCINSASLRFIPVEELEEQGYGDLLNLFAPAVGDPAVETAFFAGGCFWGVQKAFDQVPEVIKTTAGYIGGNLPNPS